MTTASIKTRPAASTRLPFLDVLRGVAIIGTLASNIWLFTVPSAEASMLVGKPGESASGGIVEFAFRFLSNGKFLATLTILFGVGIVIQFDSAKRRGLPWPGKYKWRTAFLFVEGTVHFIFVFAFDVLMGYAVVALLVAWLMTRTARFRTVVAWTAGTIHTVLMLLLSAGMATQPDSAPDPQRVQRAVDVYAHGSWFDQIAYRLDSAGPFRIEPVLTFGLLVTLFLTGVALFRAGAFGGDPKARRLRARMMAYGLGIGLPVNLATSLAGPDLFLTDRYVAAPMVAIGLIGLVGWLVDRASGGPLMTGLSRLGRMALTGYVTQNALAMVCCYGFGLNLTSIMDGQGVWWVAGLWALISGALLAGSAWWLSRFSAGPLEALQKKVLRRA